MIKQTVMRCVGASLVLGFIWAMLSLISVTIRELEYILIIMEACNVG